MNLLDCCSFSRETNASNMQCRLNNPSTTITTITSATHKTRSSPSSLHHLLHLFSLTIETLWTTHHTQTVPQHPLSVRRSLKIPLSLSLTLPNLFPREQSVFPYPSNINRSGNSGAPMNRI